jgi:hypothetical protein
LVQYIASGILKTGAALGTVSSVHSIVASVTASSTAANHKMLFVVPRYANLERKEKIFYPVLRPIKNFILSFLKSLHKTKHAYTCSQQMGKDYLFSPDKKMSSILQ